MVYSLNIDKNTTARTDWFTMFGLLRTGQNLRTKTNNHGYGYGDASQFKAYSPISGLAMMGNQ